MYHRFWPIPGDFTLCDLRSFWVFQEWGARRQDAFFSAGYGVFHSHGGTENGDFKGKFPSINALFRGIPLFRKPPSQNCSKTVENTYSSSTIFETMISCRFFNPLSPGCLPRILWKHAGQADEQTFLGIRWWRPWVCSKIWGNHAGTIKFLKNKHLRHP